MKKFVLGFIFSENREKVLLLKKRSSAPYNPDTWNGVGGHVEEGETFLEAMVRECQEESGLDIRSTRWLSMGNLTDNKSFDVEIFEAEADISQFLELTDEKLQVFTKEEVIQLVLARDVDKILSKWLAE